LRVAIKRVADGRFSNWAFDALVPGATIDVAPPSGRFHVELAPHNVRQYLGVAAGSGITPLLSIIATTLALEPHSSFTLVYGNRSTAHVMFADELQNLKDRYLGRFSLIFIMSREQQDVELFAGRIDRAKCDALFDSWIDLDAIHTTFICGPEEMTAAVRDALADHGVDTSAIKTELFAAAPRGERRVMAVATNDAPAMVQAAVVIDGRRREFEIQQGAETVLEAGLRAGIELPYSCKGGVCSTCRCILRSGEVEMDVHYALEDYEIRRGFILTCQSYPVTDSLELDLDAVSH
jgi:ring-1,2-phenylacetyl-CoA epoxidase subunit PaaE